MQQQNEWKRTRYCGEINDNDVGAEVVVNGWVQRSRDLGGLVFAQIRDRTGIVQAVFSEEISAPAFRQASDFRGEFVVGVRGTVRARSPESVNPNMPTGRYEIAASEASVFNMSETPPIYIEEDLNVNEATRFKYRYLDLRRPDMQKGIMLRHRAAKIARDFFDENGFLEIETPMLTKSTPEGARDYLVPSRVYPGEFFALPQSPQLFKQLLMVAGFDRYMQIVRCFRDEDLRADRQPEFTQIDVEMSFAARDDIIEINERFIQKLFAGTVGADIPIPFPRMTYAEAMGRYGSDKPDIRFGMEITDISSLAVGCGFSVFETAIDSGGSVRAINAKGCAGYSRKQIDALTGLAREHKAKGLAWAALADAAASGSGGTATAPARPADEIRSSFSKFVRPQVLAAMLDAVGAQPGDLALFVADASNQVVCEALGQLRLEVAKNIGLINGNTYKCLWVTDFPLLEYDEGAARWTATHHPFTAPMAEDVALLDTDPGRVRAQAYDVVINGMEAGGGSIRISDRQLQNKMLGLLGYSQEEAQERFGFLLEALKYGAPPHGGIAYGLDRLAMLLTGRDSIKDVIAFPKAQTSACAMTGAPAAVDPDQLAALGINIRANEL